MEHHVYQEVKLWSPLEEVISSEKLLEVDGYVGERELDDNAVELFNYLYDFVKDFYSSLPPRKDGSDPFLHPLNVAGYLLKAKANLWTVCGGLVHDWVEEGVDKYQREQRIGGKEEEIKRLDEHEKELLEELEALVEMSCGRREADRTSAEIVMGVLKLLTRHKRHLYYRSIAGIFMCEDEDFKERGMQVKLADRLHNVQTLSCFEGGNALYQCFKNLFVLNNVKKYLIESGKMSEEEVVYADSETTTLKLFKKCCKATYHAFLRIRAEALGKGISAVVPDLQLALKRFAHQDYGLWEVTEVQKKDCHPKKLFQGIIHKYDARLHKEEHDFQKREEQDREYCRRYFADYDYDDEQIRAIVYYKDAYALTEVMGRLLYRNNYCISGFDCSELCRRKRKCLQSAKVF